MTPRWTLLLVVLVALAAAAGGYLAQQQIHPVTDPPRVRPVRPRSPPVRAIDAAQIASGKLPLERLPAEIANTLEAHSNEIVRNAEAIDSRQARITGTCAPGSAIRVIAEDGSVSCQRLPKGIASVPALAGSPLVATTPTATGSVPGGIGRYQIGGEDDYLVVPIALPDGAVVTGFSFAYYDADKEIDGGAWLYRSDDQPMAAVTTSGAANEVRTGNTDEIQFRRVDTGRFAYWVYFQMSVKAGQNLVPVSASVSYKLP